MTKAGNTMAIQNAQYESLFRPTSIGGVDLTNRVALAPMTRVSATAEGLPTERIAAYYRTFADGGFGLLVTEGLYIDDQTSQGYHFQPGISNRAQVAAWQSAVDGGGTVGCAPSRRAVGQVSRIRAVPGARDDPCDATTVIDSGAADIVALAKPALANRDWPRRVRTGQPLSPDLPAGLFGPTATLKEWEVTAKQSVVSPWQR